MFVTHAPEQTADDPRRGKGFAEKVLANQREFAQQWASATAKASEAVTEQGAPLIVTQPPVETTAVVVSSEPVSEPIAPAEAPTITILPTIDSFTP